MNTLFFLSLTTLLLAMGTIYLQKQGKNVLPTFIPMMFILGMGLWGVAIDLHRVIPKG